MAWNRPDGAQVTDTFTDSSFGGDRVTGHADGGHLTTFKQGLVAAKASTQPAVTTNSFEAENMQLCSATKAVLKLRNYMEHDFDMPLKGPSLVRIDNEAVRAFAQNVARPQGWQGTSIRHNYMAGSSTAMA